MVPDIDPELVKEIVRIDKKAGIGLIEIGLEDAIGTINGTIGPYMEDTISAADIFFGPRTGFYQFSFKTG
jgi:hypothetical protein